MKAPILLLFLEFELPLRLSWLVIPHHCWWFWRICKRQDYANLERGLYVKIIHVNYEIFTKGNRIYPGDNVRRQIDVIGEWVGLTMTPLKLCWNDMSTFFTARYPFITTLDVILVGGCVRNITSIWRFALPRTASPNGLWSATFHFCWQLYQRF